MKISGDPIHLDDQNEIDAFNDLVSFFARFEEDKRKRAQFVFDAYCDDRFSKDVDLDDPTHNDRCEIEMDRWRNAVDDSISKNLDHRTLGAFIEVVIANESRARQSRAAEKRHAENRAMKAEVSQWLDSNMANFKSMDAAASAIAGKIAPISFRTAREWVGEWKKLRSPGTP